MDRGYLRHDSDGKFQRINMIFRDLQLSPDINKIEKDKEVNKYSMADGIYLHTNK